MRPTTLAGEGVLGSEGPFDLKPVKSEDGSLRVVATDTVEDVLRKARDAAQFFLMQKKEEQKAAEAQQAQAQKAEEEKAEAK